MTAIVTMTVETMVIMSVMMRLVMKTVGVVMVVLTLSGDETVVDGDDSDCADGALLLTVATVVIS